RVDYGRRRHHRGDRTRARGSDGAIDRTAGGRRRSVPRTRHCDETLRGCAVRGHRARAPALAPLWTQGCERPEIDGARMPVVSVIMPAYNAERYLGRAVESVLRQSFRDLELLIVDDGSSDRTVEIARGFAARDSRVRVLQQQNAGPGP